MGQDLTFKLDGEVAFNNAIKRYQRQLGQDLAKVVIPREARLLGMMLIKLTPPRNKGQGRSRVESDIAQITIGANESFIDMIMQRFGSEGITATLTTKSGEPYVLEWKKVTKSVSELERWHAQKRDFRGRSRYLVGSERLVVPKTTLKDYIKEKQDNVGMAKGGWSVGVMQLGGTVSAWISRHAKMGSFENNLRGNDPTFVFKNRSPWAGNDAETRRIVNNALRIRSRSMVTNIERQLRESGRAVGLTIKAGI